jgi:hypothetical protein
VHDGELAVITVAPRLTDGPADTLTVTGPGLTRVLSLAAGGRVLDDRVAGTDSTAQAVVELPAATERIVVVGLGTQPAAGGSFPGWYAGQSLPSVGWDTALASGAVVTAQGTRVPDNRERGDSGWLGGRDLASAALVATTFTDPVNVVAVVVDDELGGDAAAEVSIRLTDATRALGAGGAPQPPQALVDGVRTILLYAVATVGPNPRVVVEGCSHGQLAGVLGSAAGLAAVAQSLATTGVAAAVRQPLIGGPGARRVSVTLGDDATPPAPAAATAMKAAKKATANKKAAKKATAKTTEQATAEPATKKTARKGGRR